jgi:uncharacterized protein involved in response to NO
MTQPVPPNPPARPALPIRPAAPPPPPARTPQPAVAGPWRLALLMAAPHRLGFFLAMVVLVAASGWWLLVQADRAWSLLGLAAAVAPTVTHAVVMVFGFMPLFFSGFLFTAGPKWLHVQGYGTPRLLPPLALQAAGWLLWLAGAQLGLGLALAGLALACAGLAWMVGLFWRLIVASPAPDRVHATAIGVGGIVGVLCLAGVGLALLAGQPALALVLVRTALWGFIVVTFVAVAHRMIPFFTAGVLPMIEAWRPLWVLWLLLGVAAFEVLAVWVDFAAPSASAWRGWTLAVIACETLAGGVLLWLAVVWGLVQSLQIRLLAMLHVGFTWLGLALLYSAASQGLWLATGRALLGLGALHALSMGFLGSLTLAMVTRVSCGHSGRTLVADDVVWALFWLLQVATGVRLLAAVQGMPAWLTTLAVLLWMAVVAVWALRYARWYGTPRVDGQPG